MKIIVGLGNPGEKYQSNRHNVGFMVVDKLAQSMDDEKWTMNKKFNAEIIQTKEYILVKPMTFMNESGKTISSICRFYKVNHHDLYVIHDDLDIPLGSYKIQHAKGPRIHYGVNSVEQKLASEDFWRVRVGVENREVKGNTGVPGELYSLQDFRPKERKIVKEVIARIVEQLSAVVS